MNTSTTIAVVAAGMVIAIGAYLVFQNRRLLFDTCPPSTTARYVPNPHNDKALIVYGLNGDEIKKILSDFAAAYEMQHFRYLVRSEGERWKVVFPDDIEPARFSFLVNFVQYPKDIDLNERSIVSTGTTTLTPDFGLPSSALSGQKAVFYVPTSDNEYDLVFVRVGKQTYENSFAGKCWRLMDDPRMPTQAAGLEQ